MKDVPLAILLVHGGATLFMTGLIWVIQVVHYPLMAAVGREGFVAYEQSHMARIGWIVGTAMPIEAAAAAALFMFRPQGTPLWMPIVGAGLLVAIWVSTAVLQVPLHAALCKGYDERNISMLVSSNWIRTAAWSARGVLALWMIWAARPA